MPPIQALTPLRKASEGNLSQAISDIIGCIVYRYERRYKKDVMGIQYFIRDTKGELVDERYFAVQDCLKLFENASSIAISQVGPQQEITLSVTFPDKQCYVSLALITKNNQRIINSVRNTTIESIYEKLTIQKVSKELLQTFQQIDSKHFSHL